MPVCSKVKTITPRRCTFFFFFFYNTTDFIDIDSSGHSKMALEHFKTCFTEIHG